MRIAYCEDEQIQIEYMRHFLELWSKQRGIQSSLTAYGSAEEFLFETEGSYPYDLVILDIEMKQMNGMELARMIRKLDLKIPILFLTNRQEFVFEGYEVGAIHYLMKPVDQGKLDQILMLVREQEEKKPNYLFGTVRGEKIKLDLKNILHIEARGHYILVHTITVDYEWKQSLSEITEQVKGNGFLSTHRSFLVNLDYISRITRTECILTDGSRVPISRNAYKAVNEAFIQYFKGR